VGVRVIGCLKEYLETNNPGPIINWLANPAIRIVTMTITEGGYFLDRPNDEMLADGARLARGEQPLTVFGENF
jgi:mannitol-1-phosphate/altronate dehydrogenase